MDQHAVFMFILSGFLLSLYHCWNIKVPSRVLAVLDSCVLIPCYTEPHSRVIWYKYKRFGYPKVFDGKDPHEVISEFKGRTSVPGNAQEGNCSLLINNIQTDDNGLYLYVWINPDKSYSDRFYDKLVKIQTVEPRVPSLTIPMVQVDGEYFSANCSVETSCPSSPPLLNFTGPSAPINPVTTITESGGEEGLWLMVLHAHFKVTPQDHGRKVQCTSRVKDVTKASKELELNILHAALDVQITAEEKNVTEGGSFTLNCKANSKPRPHQYHWLISDTSKTVRANTSQETFLLKNTSRGTKISCIAQNTVGQRQSKQLLLDVHYRPVILSNSSCSETDGVVWCLCQAEARPEAVFTWTINRSRDLPPSLTINTTRFGHTAVSHLRGPIQGQPNVSCEAANYVGRDVHQMLFINPSNANTFLPLLVSIAVVCVLGISAVFICRRCCRKRSQPQVTEYLNRSRQVQQHKTADKHHEEDIYENDTQQVNCYGNISVPQSKEDDIYINY